MLPRKNRTVCCRKCRPRWCGSGRRSSVRRCMPSVAVRPVRKAGPGRWNRFVRHGKTGTMPRDEKSLRKCGHCAAGDAWPRSYPSVRTQQSRATATGSFRPSDCRKIDPGDARRWGCPVGIPIYCRTPLLAASTPHGPYVLPVVLIPSVSLKLLRHSSRPITIYNQHCFASWRG